ncbi:MAG: hypothetical protein NC120_01530 [Ruminococcus sp.]|nr:hypothetical protein [Ruminococcus sp.]
MDMILLAAATSADLFAAVLGIRASGIRLTLSSGFVIAAAGSVLLGLSAAVSSYADRLFPLDNALYISRAILLIMGLNTIFGDFIEKAGKRLFKRKNKLIPCAEMMNHPACADKDNSKTISVSEGMALGLALSGDSVFTGVGAGIGGMPPVKIFALSLIFGAAAIISGNAAGRFLSDKSSADFPAERIGGIILIILAFVL